MAILDDMIANVYVLTNRPDLVAETKSQIKKAAIKLHGSDFYIQDLAIATVALTPDTNFRYTVDISNSTLYPRFRKLDFIRDWNSIPTGREQYYSIKAASAILDDYKLEYQRYAYQAGLTIELRADCALTMVQMGYYTFPDIGDTTFSSWIANLSSAYLEEEAARNLFKMIGKDEEYQKYESICTDNLAAIKMAGILNN